MITLHSQVYDYLSQLIDEGTHDGLLPSQKELCEKFDVSCITVRRALGDLEKQGQIYRKKGKGSFIRKMKKKRKLKIGLILPVKMPIDDEFISGIISQARESQTILLINHFTGDQSEILKSVQENSLDGLLWIAPNDESLKTAETIREKGAPVMLFNRTAKNSHMSYISLDHRLGAEKITEYFIQRELKRILFVGHDKLNSYSDERFQGFKDVVNKNASAVKTSSIEVICKDYKPGELKDKICDKLKSFAPDAILCSQGAFLYDTLDAMKKSKTSVEIIEIATFDEAPVELDEKLAIHEIVQPLYRMGRLAISDLEAICKGEKGISRESVPPEIKIKKRETKHNLKTE
jgi:DNA-binding LacI/PurR family transcriptional regulator